MANNTTIGVGEIVNNTSGNATGMEVSFLEEKIADVFASQFAGSTQFGGLLFLTLLGFFLFKADVGNDVSLTVMIPAVFFMAQTGLLPFGDGIFYGMLLAVSALFIFGLIKFIDR